MSMYASGTAADAVPMPKLKPRAMRERIVVPSVRSSEVACAQRSRVGHREDALQPLDFSNALFSVHRSQYLTERRGGQFGAASPKDLTARFPVDPPATVRKSHPIFGMPYVHVMVPLSFRGRFLIGISSWHRSEAHRLMPSSFPQSKHQHRGREERNAEENQPTVKAPCAFADRAVTSRGSGEDSRFRTRQGLTQAGERCHERPDYVDFYLLATIYAGLGEKDEAFRLLEKGYEQRSASLLYLAIDGFWYGMRSDPRFADLLRRIGLPQPE